jgi:Mycothiol maleylpyruvate isomerase N-terminal domain
VDAFAEIADERRGLAALLSELTGEQQATQSLCRGWSVHDVAAHLVVPLEVSTRSSCWPCWHAEGTSTERTSG